MLEALDLSLRLPKSDYKDRLPRLQRRLHRLQRASWECRVATIVVFEGWQAAGKGRAIDKLTQRLEPRRFSLYAIHPPRTFEKHLPWMWRFWDKLPNWGEMAVFDLSWYGRVLSERVEGLVEEDAWRAGYADIVSFERALAEDRYSIVKFFLHVSKQEQAERFRKAASDPGMAWRVERQDWKHHEKYDQYLLAAEEMLERTESECGPWTLVEATDKRWARVKIFETLIRRMEEALQSHGCGVPDAEPDAHADTGGGSG